VRRFALLVLGLTIGTVGVGCTPSPTPATRLAITTVQTICGGAVPPPGTPACTSHPASRSVEVGQGRNVVASGTTGADGSLVLDVPSGNLVVSVPGALPYMNCDAPSVVAVAGTTTPVTQTCTLLAP
jgi:hypothetical protein